MTVTITLKLLATYRQLLPEGTGGNTCRLDIPDGSTVEEILARYDVPLGGESVILVNGHSPEPGQVLEAGDVLCAFSAIAGG